MTQQRSRPAEKSNPGRSPLDLKHGSVSRGSPRFTRLEGFVDHPVRQRPDPDTSISTVSRVSKTWGVEPHAGADGGAGGDHIPGFQFHERGDVPQQVRKPKDQVGRRVVLPCLPVHPGLEPEVVKRRNSSTVVIHGPIEPERSKFFPWVTLNLPCRSQSRTVPSFMMVSPAICCRARSSGIRRPGCRSRWQFHPRNRAASTPAAAREERHARRGNRGCG